MNYPLVSICIPTYNRCDQLEITLKSIIKQEEFLAGTVEIVISDNASTDNTQVMCQEYAKKYENCSYYRNEENLLASKNFPIALGKAKGVLRKLNNDTFTLKEKALKNLCELVLKYNSTRPPIFLSNGQHNNNEEKCLDFRSFVVEEGYLITWIASFTIWDDDCIGIESDFSDTELRLWQVRKFYECAYSKGKVVVCDKKIGEIIDVPQKNISYGLYEIFYVNYMKLLRPYIECGALDNDDIECIEKQLLFDFFCGWIIKWELGNRGKYLYSETEDLKQAVFDHYRNKTYWNDFIKIYRLERFKEMTISPIKRRIIRVLDYMTGEKQ